MRKAALMRALVVLASLVAVLASADLIDPH
jgi:hypothetical protein